MENVYINESVQTPRQSIQINGEETVGFEDDAARIIKLLTRGTKELDIISIVGMPGLGKTTLAKRIYKDSSVTSYFDVRSWCTISQSYDVKELLRHIYRQVASVKDVDNNCDIADMLRKCLIGRRYLIVLDDMWEAKAWEEIRLCFPKGGNGNRIMLTSRIKQVAEEVMPHKDPYCLRFLTTEESWKLLQKKAFQKETCPPELMDVGLQIAEYCKGLPLTVVLISGIIAKRQRNALEWREIANNLKSHFGANENEVNLAIQLSYRYLPDHLRYCLLTMGVFREDQKIEVPQLMLLWMAEGYGDQRSDERGLEEVVDGYLMDLISSSLVMVSKTSSNGKVKYLQVHDLVRDFCLNKAKEEKFMHVIGSHNQYQPSYDGEHRVCSHINEKMVLRNVQFKRDYGDPILDDFLTCNSEKGTSFGQNLSSVFVNYSSEFSDLFIPFSLSSLCDFKLLRVFDLVNCALKGYEKILQSLVHLRYLRMCCDDFHFEWVSHLCYLETLMVDTKDVVVGSPHIWKMSRLRHVEVRAVLPRGIAISEEPSKLGNVRTFKGMFLEEDDIEYLVERFPNLQNLSLQVNIQSCLGESNCVKLQVLTELESLVLYFEARMTKLFHLPSSLKELILHKARISKCAASIIAGLPILGKLKFAECKFEEGEWDVKDVEFSALKFLKFQKAALRKWHVSESSFPMLEILVIKHCRKLHKIPSSFAEVQTLKLIQVISCPRFLGASALEIREEVEVTTGCDSLDIYIYPPYSRRMAEELTDDQISECKEAFSHFDKDGDGYVTIKQLVAAMRSLGQCPTEVELQDMIYGLDTSIDFSEFLNLMASKMKESPFPKEQLKAMLDPNLDICSDNFISAAALHQLQLNLGYGLQNDDIDRMIREADGYDEREVADMAKGKSEEEEREGEAEKGKEAATDIETHEKEEQEEASILFGEKFVLKLEP